MVAVIIAAGRGSRLQHETTVIPKTLVPVCGRPMLDWILEALAEGGFTRRDVIVITGYAEDVLRSRYPDLRFVRNERWEHNNILQSLLTARSELSDGFVSTYADIVYEGAVVKKLVDSPRDLVLGSDTAWRRRYVGRSQHPETDAEKLSDENGRVLRISRRIPSEEATGEFIGVMKATAGGATALLSAYDEVAKQAGDGAWREGRTFQRAYLIDLLQHMLERGAEMHCEVTNGGYMEIDTLEDLAFAEQWWSERPCAQ